MAPVVEGVITQWREGRRQGQTVTEAECGRRGV